MKTEGLIRHKIISPPFSPTCINKLYIDRFLRGHKWGSTEGANCRASIEAISKQSIKLRKEFTPAERKLWACLRNKQQGVNFRRQHPIGIYITDFCSHKARPIIELDGSQHLEQEEYDKETAGLQSPSLLE